MCESESDACPMVTQCDAKERTMVFVEPNLVVGSKTRRCYCIAVIREGGDCGSI